jgi:polyhydroxyalkanoate synthesis repressor PhaR
MPVIKRYPNRKLYDTEAKRYVTLEHITKMVREGQDVRVVDHETGEDLTSLTLSQIILEQEKKQTGFLPRSLLTSLIRTGGETVESLVRSVQGTLPLAKPTLLEEKMKQLVDAGQLTSEQAAAVLKALQPTEILDENLTHFLHRLNIPTNQDIRVLQQQLAELTDKLAELLEETPDESASVDDGSLPGDLSPSKQDSK